MGKVIYADFRPKAAFNRKSPPRREDEHISLVLKAIADRDTAFLNTLDPATDRGIRAFRLHSVEHRFLRAVHENSTLSAKIILTADYPHFDKNALTLWVTPGDSSVHFLTAAHLARSRKMIDLLLEHNVDFHKLSDRGMHPFVMIGRNTDNADIKAFLKENKYDPDYLPLSIRFPDLGL
jgi:hypothetical protein